MRSIHNDDLLLNARNEIVGLFGQRLGQTTDRVIAAVEYGYGQQHRGEQINMYRLLSGYAHGSVEIFFAHTSAAAPQVACLQASAGELHGLISLCLRTYSAALDMATAMMGRSPSRLHKWESECDEFILVAPQTA
jgi:hypothetical protein